MSPRTFRPNRTRDDAPRTPQTEASDLAAGDAALEQFRLANSASDEAHFRLSSATDTAFAVLPDADGVRHPASARTKPAAPSPAVRVSAPPPAARQNASPVPSLSPRLLDDLAAAVIAWWQAAALPSNTLLRDGLLALEAGVVLEPSHRTLLARTALARGLGAVTALRHLADPERAASLVQEAWMTGALDEPGFAALLQEARLGDEWQRYLTDDLRAELSPLPHAASLRADRGLQIVAAELAQRRAREAGVDYALVDAPEAPAPFHRLLLALLAALLVGLAGWWLWQTRMPAYGDVVAVNAGVYATTTLEGAAHPAALGAFFIDRTEATNQRYSACYAAGSCPYPASLDAPARRDYFLDPQYAAFPVVNVSHAAAEAYCAWRGMRLPTAEEFEVAARFAPLSNRNYRYPWGELFASALVVSAEQFDSTALVGSRSPQGDSPLGIADLSGNVAEWTSSTPLDVPQVALVKGGSFRDRGVEPTPLNPARAQSVAKASAHPWLGFRCAVAIPPSR